MTVYELNQMVYSNQLALAADSIKTASQMIDEWHQTIGSKYYMLLAQDINYYTVFIADGQSAETLGEAAIDCIKNRAHNGEILSIEKEDNAIEFWFNITEAAKDGSPIVNKKAICAYLFDYSSGIIPIKGG